MKTYIVFTLIGLNLFLIDYAFAQMQEPVIVSPLIGEKLARVEEEYFRLVPTFDNVQEAVFYLNSDSSLNVLVTYEEMGAVKDTLILNYMSLAKLNNYIDYQLTQDRNVDQNIEHGKYVNILTKTDSVDGELLAINSNSLSILKLGLSEYREAYQPPFDVIYFTDKNIDKLIVYDVSNYAKIIYPTVLALGLGITAGVIAKNNVEDEKSDLSDGINFNFTPVLYAMLGGLAGYLIGWGLSEIFPIISLSETEYTPPFNEVDIQGLKYMSRYKK